jgi:hypothetical protein
MCRSEKLCEKPDTDKKKVKEHTSTVTRESNLMGGMTLTQGPCMCTNCKRPWHTSDKCFAPGGGLSHYNQDERHAHMQQRRKERNAANGGLSSGTAMVAYQGGGDTTELELMRAENKRTKEQVKDMGYNLDLK